MVLCLIALPIFAFLSLFSVKYRKLTSDSLDCLFRTVTLRKCQSGLDDRIRSGISGMLLKVSPKAAKFVYKYYKVLSIIMIILFIWSAWISGEAIYNYVNYGNCNGPDSDGFCIFNVGEDSVVSNVDGLLCNNAILSFINSEGVVR